MKRIRTFSILFLIVGFLLTTFYACEKTDDTGGDFPSAGIIKDIDGNIYHTLKIGTQVWTVENLRTTHYNDGTEILKVTSDTVWANLMTAAYCNFNNAESNATIYGMLYNWYAAITWKLPPIGWHVASYNDWVILQNHLIANGYDYEGIKYSDRIAKSLCAKTNWTISDIPGTPGAVAENNNRTGFSALPVGFRTEEGVFCHNGTVCQWWGSSFVTDNIKDEGTTWCINNEDIRLREESRIYRNGYSIRLVKN